MSVKQLENKLRKRAKRKFSVRKSIAGTAARPRMTVFKSNIHLYVQVIDDDAGTTYRLHCDWSLSHISP